MDFPTAIRLTWLMRRPRYTPPEKREHQWAITLIRQRGKFLGYVRAPDAETAIREAIKHFEIKDPEQQKRLIAQRSD
jgi:Ser/Thr protein kinase RdoA (MazF antagonist)